MPDALAQIRRHIGEIYVRARAMARDPENPAHVREEATNFVLLTNDIPGALDAIQRVIECYERDIRELRNEALWREQARNEELARYHAADASDSAPIQIPLTREPHRAASGE